MVKLFKKKATEKAESTTAAVTGSNAQKVSANTSNRMKLAGVLVIVVVIVAAGFLSWRVYNRDHHKITPGVYPKAQIKGQGKFYEPIPAGQPGSKSKPARTG